MKISKYVVLIVLSNIIAIKLADFVLAELIKKQGEVAIVEHICVSPAFCLDAERDLVIK